MNEEKGATKENLQKKLQGRGHTNNKHSTEITNYRLNPPWGRFSENSKESRQTHKHMDGHNNLLTELAWGQVR